MDRFDNLQAFVAVVETGSFTAAAERLDVAKSAVSRRVSSLEERLGVQLLRRTTRRLNLTETGASFYERSARILADLDEAESAVAQAHGELRGTLRIALPLGFSVMHMSEPIAAFAREHPKLEFDLDLNDRRIDLLQEGVDLALRIGRLEDSSLVARKLFDVKSVVCASPGYLDEHGEPDTLEAMSEHASLVYGNLPEPDRWVGRDANGERHEALLSPVMRATSGDFLRQCASEGMGVVMLPTFLASAGIASGRLRPILTDYEWPASPAYAVYPPTRHLVYRVRRFIDFLADTFSGTTPWDRECGTGERPA